jgi:hypothetical protein
MQKLAFDRMEKSRKIEAPIRYAQFFMKRAPINIYYDWAWEYRLSVDTLTKQSIPQTPTKNRFIYGRRVDISFQTILAKIVNPRIRFEKTKVPEFFKLLRDIFQYTVNLAYSK